MNITPFPITEGRLKGKIMEFTFDGYKNQVLGRMEGAKHWKPVHASNVDGRKLTVYLHPVGNKGDVIMSSFIFYDVVSKIKNA